MPTENITVCKTFKFEAAHRLPYHDGQCANEHGHSYVVQLCFLGPVQPDDPDNPEAGMVIDFAKISASWKQLARHLDHKHLNTWLTNPTAERICLSIYDFFEMEYPHLTLTRVRVHETDTSYVEWSLHDNLRNP